WVKFPIADFEPIYSRLAPETLADKETEFLKLWDRIKDASILIWTTTPWTIPGNRAISFSPRIEYGLYEITGAPADNWAKEGDLIVIADRLGVGVLRQARVASFKKLAAVGVEHLERIVCGHPLNGVGGGYQFRVPLLAGDHVTDDTGTGFVHTAPGHGREDFDIWTANARKLEE